MVTIRDGPLPCLDCWRSQWRERRERSPLTSGKRAFRCASRAPSPGGATALHPLCTIVHHCAPLCTILYRPAQLSPSWECTGCSHPERRPETPRGRGTRLAAPQPTWRTPEAASPSPSLCTDQHVPSHRTQARRLFRLPLCQLEKTDSEMIKTSHPDVAKVLALTSTRASSPRSPCRMMCRDGTFWVLAFAVYAMGVERSVRKDPTR